jgi:hypothetical protein
MPSSALACEAEKVTRITIIASSFLMIYGVVDLSLEPKISKYILRNNDFNIL